jgi:hypothetical protein
MENPIESLVFGGLEPKLKPTAPQNFCHPLDCDHPQEISLWKELLNKKIQQKKKTNRGEDVFSCLATKNPNQWDFPWDFM